MSGVLDWYQETGTKRNATGVAPHAARWRPHRRGLPWCVHSARMSARHQACFVCFTKCACAAAHATHWGRAGNQYYEDREEAARSCLPRRGRFLVYHSVVADASPAPGQPPVRYMPSCNRADPGSQIPTEWCDSA